MSVVTNAAAAPIERALSHFRDRLSFETDCWDVHHSIEQGEQDFVLLDVRGPNAYEKGHLPTAIHLPHWEITQEALSAFPRDALFVVYCAGPHCNGANRGAIRLLELGRSVKEMIGGVTGWVDEGFDLVAGSGEAGHRAPCQLETPRAA